MRSRSVIALALLSVVALGTPPIAQSTKVLKPPGPQSNSPRAIVLTEDVVAALFAKLMATRLPAPELPASPPTEPPVSRE